MSSGARTGLIIVVVVILVAIAAFAFGLVDVRQTRDARLPEVRAEGGQLPAFNVNTARVEVGKKTTDIEVPKVEVGREKVGVEVPTVDVKPAD